MSSSEEEDYYGSNREKICRIIDAVKENDIDLLKALLDAPKWYKVRDRPSQETPLLNIAILWDNKEVFDYLLSSPDCPLEAYNFYGYTALNTSLTDFTFSLGKDVPIHMREYYALELIKRGANVHSLNFDDRNGTLLHNALEMDLIEVAKLLIKKGVDVNKRNNHRVTPLQQCLCGGEDYLVERVSMLLYHGADPMILNYEGFTFIDLIAQYWVQNTDCDTSMAKNFLLHNIFNQYVDYVLDAGVFLQVMECDSSISYKVIKNTREVIFNYSLENGYIAKLFTMKTDFLKVIIEKFDYLVTELLCTSDWVRFISSAKPIKIENFGVLLQSKLKLKFTAWLCDVDMEEAIYDLIGRTQTDLSTIEEFICLLLSYGRRVSERDLQTVYQKFGYSELFKILLHMDVEKDYPMTNIIPYILYNVTLDIPKMVLDKSLFSAQFSIKHLEELLPYYTIPFNLLKDGLESVQNQPRLPLLVELARNVFRRYFIERLSIRNAKQFYTFVKLLPISNYHEQIITLEAKLY